MWKVFAFKTYDNKINQKKIDGFSEKKILKNNKNKVIVGILNNTFFYYFNIL